ncbi:hypothetical protein ACRAWD_30940 [Caulobacter segnis]
MFESLIPGVERWAGLEEIAAAAPFRGPGRMSFAGHRGAHGRVDGGRVSVA